MRNLSILLVAACAPLAAQSVQVTAANPNVTEQGTINLNVTISGKGFKNGAQARFRVSGTTNPGGITVRSTSFVSSTTVVANIDVADTADIALFDVAVDNPDGRGGQGTELFSVVAKGGGPSACTVLPLPPQFSFVAQLNGSGAPYECLGRWTRSRQIELGGKTVVMIAAGQTCVNRAELFFVDPVTGAILDGTTIGSASGPQPHVTLSTPAGAMAQGAFGDFNSDGIADLVVGNVAGTVYLGQLSGGILSYSGGTTLVASETLEGTNFVATGPLDAAPGDEIAVGKYGGGNGNSAKPGKVFLFRYNGAGFAEYAKIADPLADANSHFGARVAIGDVTGDGSLDLIVGAPSGKINRTTQAGRVWVFSGPSFPTSSAFSLTTVGAYDGFGSGVSAGNMSGAPGGFVDLIAAKSQEKNQVNIYAGPVASSSAVWQTLLPPASLSNPGNFGGMHLDAADLNGDGRADLVVGAPGAGKSTSCTPGAAHVFLTNPTGPPSGYVIQPPQPGTGGFGWAVDAIPGTRLFVVSDPGGVGQVYVFKVN